MRWRLVATVSCMACGAAVGFAPTPGATPPRAGGCPTRLSAKKSGTSTKQTKAASTKISLRGFGGTAKPKANAASAATAPEGTVLRSLAVTRWFDTAGLDMRKVAVADFGGLRGVMALESIKKGQCIVEVPVKAAIDLGDEGSDPTLPALELLKVWSNPDSRWRPYLDSLPQPGSVDLTTTDFFTEEALAMLQWPPVIEETRARLQKCEQLYDDVIKLQLETGTAFHGKEVTLDDLKWAVFIVVSRALTVVRADDVSYAKLLIPGIDMFNHDANSPHVLTGRVAAGAKLKVVAGADIKAGTQIKFAYSGGTPRSDRFIQDYGFLDSEGCAKQDALVLASSLGKRYVSELDKTTMEQDQQLAEGKLGPTEELAVNFRLSLKKILAERQQ